MKNKVLIAVDLSDQSNEIIQQGIELAIKMNAYVILCAIIPIYVDYLQTQLAMIPPQLDEVYKAQEQHANKVFEEIKSNHAGVTFDTHVAIGNPKFDIMDLATKQKVDYIVVGTHGRTGLSHTIMGSTAEYIVRHATVPVLVVPMKRHAH